MDFDKQLSMALYALTRCGFRWGMYVLVTGASPQGLALACLAKHSGAAGVWVCTNGDAEAARVNSLGLNAFPMGEGAKSAAEKATQGRMFDLAFEATGTPEGYDVLLASIKRGAAAGILAKPDMPYSFYVKDAVRSQIRFVGIKTPDGRSAAQARALTSSGALNDMKTRLVQE